MQVAPVENFWVVRQGGWAHDDDDGLMPERHAYVARVVHLVYEKDADGETSITPVDVSDVAQGSVDNEMAALVCAPFKSREDAVESARQRLTSCCDGIEVETSQDGKHFVSFFTRHSDDCWSWRYSLSRHAKRTGVAS